MRLAQIGIISSSIESDSASPTIASTTVENLTPNVIALQLADASNLSDVVPDNTAWSISGAANNPTVTSQVVDEIAKIVYLFLNANILDDDTPLLTYVNPGDGSGIQDEHGNELASFSNSGITNNTGVLPTFSGNDNLLWLYTSTGVSGSTVEDRSGLNNDGSLVKSHCATFTTSTVLTCTTSLAGITVTSHSGTATISVSGNTIICSSGGTVYNCLLSNGSLLRFAEGAGTQVMSELGTTALIFNVTGGTIDWTATQDTVHDNHNKGFSHLGRLAAINQYVALTTNIAFSTLKFSIRIRYAPDSIVTSQDLLGTATTANQLSMGTSAGSISGTLRLASGTTYTLTCADTPATIGYANNTFCDIILTRNGLGVVTCTLNGFTLLINGSASVTDAGNTTFSQLCRTSTANSNIGILEEVEILDSANQPTTIGQKYNADNGFLGTLQGGMILVKYARPQGGETVHRNTAGNWHNGAETRLKPNPSNNAAITAATGWDNTTELTYAQLTSSVIVNPAFINETNPIRKRNLVLWENTLSYEEEIQANNLVGKTTINITNATGWSTANHLDLVAGSSHAAALAMTIKLVLRPSGSLYTTSQFIFGKTAAIDGNDWGFGSTANASGSDFYFWVRNGANAVVKSRNITFIEKDTNLCVILAGIRSDGVGGYEIWIAKDGAVENTVVPLVGLTTSTSNLVIGSFSGGNAFVGGIIAAAYGTQELTDNEIEASYQQTKNNVYVEESWMSLLFGSESGNANWVDRIGGSVTLTKSGTITTATVNQAFNNRWRPEDWPSDTVPLALTPLPTPNVCFYGDSRVVGGFSENGVGFRQMFRDRADLDPDISGLVMVGSQGSSPINHYGLNGKDSSTLMSEAPGILTVNTTYNADIAVVFIGINAMTTNTLLDREINEYEDLLFTFVRDLGTDVRIVLLSEVEHNYAHRRARQQYLMDNRCRILIQKLRDQGNHIIFGNIYRTIKNMDGDFIVEAGDPLVHPNDQGNGKLEEPIFNFVKLAAGYAI